MCPFRQPLAAARLGADTRQDWGVARSALAPGNPHKAAGRIFHSGAPDFDAFGISGESLKPWRSFSRASHSVSTVVTPMLTCTVTL